MTKKQEHGDHAVEKRKIRNIVDDSIEYGIEYGLEDGLEVGIEKGIGKGITQGMSSTAVNGIEEAISDVLTDDLDPPVNTNGPEEVSPAKKRRKRIIFVVKMVIVAMVLAWIALRLYQAREEIIKYEWQVHYGWILMSSLFYLIAFMPAAILWYLSLHWMGQGVGFFPAVRAFYASQLGKYIPGKAMVVVIRSGMVSGEHVRMSVAAVCVFYETLTMMATGAFLSAMIIAIYFREHWVYSLLSLGTMFAAGLPILPPLFVRIISILRIGKKDPLLGDYLRKITWRSVAAGMSLMTVLWIFFGIGLWAAIQGLGVTPGDFMANMPRYLSVTALSIVLGFAVPIAPGGIGIREAILSILLIPYFETILAMPENASVHVQADNLALIVSLEQRIISILSELALVGLFFLIPFIRRLTQSLRRG